MAINPIPKPEGWTSASWAAYMRTRSGSCMDPVRAAQFALTADKYDVLAKRFPEQVHVYHQDLGIQQELRRREVSARRRNYRARK